MQMQAALINSKPQYGFNPLGTDKTGKMTQCNCASWASQEPSAGSPEPT